jgi:ribosome-binding protein aMBF1 (putative translation factor)
MTGRGSFTALSVVAALGLSACGAGGASTPAPPAPPATAQVTAQAKPQHVRQSTSFPAKFKARVNTKCKRVTAQVKAINRRKGDPAERLRQLRDVVETVATDFEQIKAPARNKRAWKRYAAVFRDGADWVDRIESEVADGDIAAFNRLGATVKRVDRRTNALSARYGFGDCADD